MSIPGVRGNKVPENQEPEEPQGQSAESSTRSGMAADGDSLESAETRGEFYYRTGEIDFTGGGYSYGEGLENNGQSFVVGEVYRDEEHSGNAVAIGFKIENARLAGKNVDVDLSLTGSSFMTERGLRDSHALEVGIGKDPHLKAGVDIFFGFLLGLAGSADFGELGEGHLGVAAGIGFGLIYDLDLGLKGEKLSGELDLGLGMGISGVIELGFTLNLADAGDMLGYVAGGGWARPALDSALEQAGEASHAASDFASDVAEGVQDAAEGAADWIADTFNW